jgi:hypothetical protein
MSQTKAQLIEGFNISTSAPADALVIDSSGRLLLGTTTEGEAGADDLTIATSSTTGITIRSGTSNAGNIYFSDGTSGAAEYRGQVSYLHNADSLAFATDAAERARIDSSGRFLVGTTSTRSNIASVAQDVVIERASIVSQSLVANQNASGGSTLSLCLSRGTSVGSNTVVQSGDAVGQLAFRGNDGTNFLNLGMVRGEVDGTPGTNDMPGRLTFSTTADGASSPTERMRIDSSGRLLVGSTSAVTNVLTFTPVVQVEGTTANTSRITAIRNAAAAGAYPSFIGAKSRGTSNGSYTIVQSGDKIGAVQFGGADGAKFVDACSIFGEVDGTPGLNDMPGRLVFNTTSDGASSPTERMRIDSSGRLLIGGTNTYHANADDLVVQGTGQVGVTIASTSTGKSNLFFADDTSNPGTYACYFEYDHSADALKIGQGNSERIRLDSSGDVGIGTSSPDLKLEVSGGQNQTANTFTDLLRVAANANNDAADAEVQLNFGIQPSHTDAANRVARIQSITQGGDTKNLLINPSGGNVGIGTTSPNGALQVSRGSGNAKIFIHRTNAAANTNDYGSIIWRSNDGNNNGVIATARQSAENDGYMFFSTASGGSLGERLRIQAAGGISFNGDSAAANALDDYEQGTWNPTVAFGGSSSGVAYNEREGIYIKIGNLIWVSMVLSLTSNGTGTGDITISLPYAVGDNSENRAVGNLAYFANFSGLNSNPNVYAPSGGSTTCRLQHLNNSSGSGTQVTTLTHGNVTNSASWRAALMYTTMD